MKFTQYISPWHEGRRTKTVIDRHESKVWMVFQESGAANSSSNPQKLTAAEIAGLESFLATTCERTDHN